MKKRISTSTETIARKDLKAVEYYTTQVERNSLLTEEEEKEIATKAHQGDQDAIDKLVTGNLRFAFQIAKNYIGMGIPFEDLIQEANFGLTRAARDFDPAQGVRFISYAVYRIQEACTYAINKYSRTIHVPREKSELIGKINRTIQEMKMESSSEEVDYENVAKLLDLKEADVKEALSWDKPISSIDNAFDEDGDLTIGGTLAGDDFADANLMKQADQQQLCRFLHATLNENQLYVIKHYYGIGSKARTFAEIAAEMSLSSERVRQIRNESLKAMRSKERLFKLSE